MYMSIFLPTVSEDDINITIPVNTITHDSAEVNLIVPNHSLFTKSTITLSVRKSEFLGLYYIRNGDHQVVLTSDSYSTVFNSLKPNTNYNVKVRIESFPKRLKPVVKRWYNFRTQGMNIIIDYVIINNKIYDYRGLGKSAYK